MTRYDIDVDHLVAHALPGEDTSDLGPRIEARLGSLADGTAGPVVDLADRVAAEVWSRVQQAREARG